MNCKIESLRFSKGLSYQPDYPLNLDRIPVNARIVNPYNGDASGVPEPAMPGSKVHDAMMRDLVRLRQEVMMDIWPAWYFEKHGVSGTLSPVLTGPRAGLSEANPKGCADAVRMDQPSELWAAITDYAASEGLRPEGADPKGIRFLEQYVNPLELFGRLVSEQMHKAFLAKWYYGMPRPEEFFDFENFAQYPEGCPNHAAYPAGHGTVGGVANYCFNRTWPDAPDHAVRDVYNATAQFALFRDLAGVHTAQDSLVGHALGNMQFAN